MAALRPLEHALLARAVALFAHGALSADLEHPRHTVVDRGAVQALEGVHAAEAIRAGER
jgi:hypothetical protein